MLIKGVVHTKWCPFTRIVVHWLKVFVDYVKKQNNTTILWPNLTVNKFVFVLKLL